MSPYFLFDQQQIWLIYPFKNAGEKEDIPSGREKDGVNWYLYEMGKKSSGCAGYR